MAMAKKCDRCGKLYEGYHVKGNDFGMNGVAEISFAANDNYSVKNRLIYVQNVKSHSKNGGITNSAQSAKPVYIPQQLLT